MTHIDAPFHTRGESLYVDDVDPPHGMLYAHVVGSPVARGHSLQIDTAQAASSRGVVSILTAGDIPGENQIGPIIADETLLAIDSVAYIGQPVAVVIAEDPDLARDAASKVKITVETLPPIVDPRQAFDKGELIAAPRTFEIGDVEAGFSEATHIVEGRCDIAGQEHLYLETQRARAICQEGERVTIYSSTQSPYAVQKAAARILGVSEHMVEVDVKRLGGGFGGKEDQATAWACLAALAAKHTGRAVELVLHRIDDLQMTGKRHPYSADFKLGLSDEGDLIALSMRLYQNSGATADLSTAVLERSLFHATNAYRIPHARIFAAPCRTNLHSHTAFRGFGGPQSMFVMEAAIAQAARQTGIPRETIQRRNLLQEGDVFPYGQVATRVRAESTWDYAMDTFGFDELQAKVRDFNANNHTLKKGLSVMPVCFGISFTKTFLNQASALVHVYTDGSVSVSTGGVEMGQGVITNIAHIAAQTLGIPRSMCSIESTNTTRIANMSPSAASATTDLNGNATIAACEQILHRLYRIASEKLACDPTSLTFNDGVLYQAEHPTELTWHKVVLDAYLSRVSLSAHGFYATPEISFDASVEKGHPFAYHVYGTCITEVTVDCLRGRYEIDKALVAHDLGRPINPVVDLGQIEGGLAQGLGWMTLEELAYDSQGRLLSSALSTYKAPDAFCTPAELRVEMISHDNPPGPLGSKATGEPPLMYGIGVYFAIQDAMQAFDPSLTLRFDAPMTPERVLMQLRSHQLPKGEEQMATAADRGELT